LLDNHILINLTKKIKKEIAPFLPTPKGGGFSALFGEFMTFKTKRLL